MMVAGTDWNNYDLVRDILQEVEVLGCRHVASAKDAYDQFRKDAAVNVRTGRREAFKGSNASHGANHNVTLGESLHRNHYNHISVLWPLNWKFLSWHALGMQGNERDLRTRSVLTPAL